MPQGIVLSFQPGGRVNPIRIQLGPMPKMLSAIIGDLVDAEPDMVVVGRCAEGDEALSSARDNGADMLIAEETSAAGTCLEALLAAPPLEVFAIASHGMGGDALSLTRRPMSLKDGPSALTAALRSIAEAR